ncbi:transposase [Azospirillum sp. HJ39]
MCDKRFTSAYLYAAICPASGADSALVMPTVSTTVMSPFLDGVSRSLEPDIQAVLPLDRSGWHGSRALVVPDNITLVPLPPYSPELNPVERVWLYLRERFLSHHRLLDDADAVVQACCDAWNALADTPGHLRSLTSYPWLSCVNNWAWRYQFHSAIGPLLGDMFRPLSTVCVVKAVLFAPSVLRHYSAGKPVLDQFGDLISGQIGLTGNHSEQAVGDSCEASRPFQGFGIGHRADGSHDVGAATEPGPKVGRDVTDEIMPPTVGAKKAVLGVRGHGHTTFRHVHSGSA